MKIGKIIVMLLAAGALCAEPAAELPKIKVALAGSSACQTYNSKDPKLIWGWGEVIGKYFKPEAQVLNFAVSGLSTRSFRDRGVWKKLLDSKPDYIFMTLGANDTPGKKFATDAKTSYKENLRRYAAEAEAAGAKIIFVTLNQSLRGDPKTNKAVFFNGRAYRKDRAPYSQSIREVAAELKKPCLELFDNQQKIMEAMGEAAAGKLYRFKPDGKIDAMHTNKAGAELLAKIIITELRKSDCPLNEYTIDPQLKAPLPKETPAKKAAPAKKTHKKSSQSKKNSKK